jgi:hypothetical protein
MITNILEYEPTKGNHPPLITEKDFKAVQLSLASNYQRGTISKTNIHDKELYLKRYLK